MLLASGCTRVVYRDRAVSVPVPVVQALPAELLVDCRPDYQIPDAELTVRQVVERLHSVEAALAMCRGRLAAIRAGQ